ncbi:MAG TPA: ABC transporter permease subunit [Candidatus Dormibacteraeota bacterium]|jgi:NitT/TauT family transport system permease protein|nr:ABC transporter permease subunit [Candidatus Dormibacteraeota bacterium]
MPRSRQDESHSSSDDRALRFPTNIVPWLREGFGLIDVLVLIGLGVVIYLLVRSASSWTGPYQPKVSISLSPAALPAYAGLSTLRMLLAYVLSIAFTLVYGSIAASRPVAEKFMIPILDILQSVPILSFMPGVVLTLVAIFPGRDLGVELSSVVLIFTSMAWNLTFSFYHSLRSVPSELTEASRLYRLTRWQRFTRRDLPAGVIGLVWNSMMSWAGGWFFLMAAETFTEGNRDFRLPGLGSYLQAAANAGDVGAILLGVLTLVVLIVVIDQLLWRPLIAWSDRFRVEMTESSDLPRSWFLELLQDSTLLRTIGRSMARTREGIQDARLRRERRPRPQPSPAVRRAGRRIANVTVAVIALVALAVGAAASLRLAVQVSPGEFLILVEDFFLTLSRVIVALIVGVLWTVPVGVAIGLNPRLARITQPIVQVVASVPATAVFPILVGLLLQLRGGLELAAVLLMLLGTQWYLLFNIIAGASSIPTELREAGRVFKLRRIHWWRTLVLPSLFPYLLTGLLTATGGAWNASIVSEYVSYRGRVSMIRGLGSAITYSAARGSYGELLVATLVMALGVALINRLVWKRLFAISESRFRLGT